MYRTYFPGLNSLRFYAALAVIVFHIELNVSPLPLFYLPLKPFIIDADSAVNFFFVLSGFLVTYLLLAESLENGKISIRKYYIRRALRILPLYYVVTTLGLLIFPLFFDPGYSLNVFYPNYPDITVSKTTKVILSFLLLPNFARISAPMVHLWTIGVEMQFYAFWPWVVQKKKIIQVSLGILIIKLGLAFVLPFLPIPNVINVFYGLRFECMAIGALGAYAYFNKFPKLEWIYHRGIQVLALGVFVCIAIIEVERNTFTAVFKSIIFIVIILNIGTNPNSLISLNHKILERLGQISYGLYLYHFPILYLLTKITPNFSHFNGYLYSTIIFVGTMGCTGLVSEISYRWFEQPILGFKNYLTQRKRIGCA